MVTYSRDFCSFNHDRKGKEMMRKSIRWFVILILVGLGSVLFRMADAQQETQPLRIAVVNVGKVLSECRENLNRESESEARSRKIQAELKRLRDEVDAIAQELQNAVKPGSDEHKKLFLDWFNKRALEDAYEKGQAEVIAAESQAWLENLYNTALNEIQRVASQKQISLVIYKDEIDSRPKKLADMYQIIRNRKVLYSSPSLDISADVIKQMDLAYEKQVNK